MSFYNIEFLNLVYFKKHQNISIILQINLLNTIYWQF